MYVCCMAYNSVYDMVVLCSSALSQNGCKMAMVTLRKQDIAGKFPLNL